MQNGDSKTSRFLNWVAPFTPAHKLPPINLRGVYQLPLDRGVHVTTTPGVFGKHCVAIFWYANTLALFDDDGDAHVAEVNAYTAPSRAFHEAALR